MVWCKKDIKHINVVIPNYILRDEFGEPSAPPIGPAMVAASLRDAGYEISIVDADAENLSIVEASDRVLGLEPDVVGISCNYITKHNPSIELARQIKKQSDVFVFIGGNHASAYGHAFLQVDGFPIDLVLRGEGEIGAPLLIDALNGKGSLENVPGACVLLQGKVCEFSPSRHVDNLDALPLPAYDLLPMEEYGRHELVTSRGCPYRCSYCASTCIAGTRVRLRSPASVVEEIDLLRRNYGERFMWISDDTFTAVAKHAKSIVAAMADLNLIPQWSCLSTATTLSDDLLIAMKKAGCEYTSIGVESTHPAHRRFIGKPISDEIVIRAVERIHNAGLLVYGFFIIGFPGENRETLEARYRLIERAKFDDVAANLLIPLPGTAIWKELLDKRLFDPRNLEMDYLFARVADEGDSYKTAVLLEKWTELTASELLEGVARCRQIAKAASPNYVPRASRKR